jgi:hypothetical protein
LVVDKTDLKTRRTSLVSRPDFVIEKNERITADVHARDTTAKFKDIYAELVKLNDLQKKASSPKQSSTQKIKDSWI